MIFDNFTFSFLNNFLNFFTYNRFLENPKVSKNTPTYMDFQPNLFQNVFFGFFVRFLPFWIWIWGVIVHENVENPKSTPANPAEALRSDRREISAKQKWDSVWTGFQFSSLNWNWKTGFQFKLDSSLKLGNWWPSRPSQFFSVIGCKTGFQL